MNKISGSILFSITAVFLSGCGDKNTTSSSSGVSASLVVSSLATSSFSQSNAFKPFETDFDDVIKSTTSFSYAKLDGIKVTIKEVRGSDVDSGNPLTTLTLNKEIELTDDPTQTIALNETVSWEAGDYRGVELRLANEFKVKAYCKTALSGAAYTLVYTTATEVKTVTCANDAACATLPTDYDYFTYDELDHYYTVNGGDPSLQTFLNFSVAADSTPKIQLLFDATHTVACWNGTGFSTLPDDSSLGAFRGPSTLADRQDRWANGTPAFAVPVLPLIAYVSTDADEATPTARAFFAASSSAYLSDITQNLQNTATFTVLYNADGDPVSGSTRNVAGGFVEISGVIEGFTANVTAGWDFFASGWYWDGVDGSAPEFIRNRQFVGFDPSNDYTTVFSSTVENGTGCGQTKTDHNGDNASKDCLGSNGTYYFLETQR